MPTDAWFHVQIRRAVAAGYLTGYEDNTARPNNNITRAEVAVLVNQILDLPAAASNNFNDYYDMPSWAAPSINAVAEAGIISGYPDGSFRATNNITRAESAVLFTFVREVLENQEEVEEADELVISSNYGPATGTETIDGNVRITSGLTLRNVVINGDLYIDSSAGTNLVTLTNVTVNGHVYVDSRNVRLGNKFDNVHLTAENATLRLTNGTITNLYITSSARNFNLILDRDTVVTNAFIDASGRISGNGRIMTATITVNGVTVTNNDIIRSYASGSRRASLVTSGGESNGGIGGNGDSGLGPNPGTSNPSANITQGANITVDENEKINEVIIIKTTDLTFASNLSNVSSWFTADNDVELVATVNSISGGDVIIHLTSTTGITEDFDINVVILPRDLIVTNSRVNVGTINVTVNTVTPLPNTFPTDEQKANGISKITHNFIELVKPDNMVMVIVELYAGLENIADRVHTTYNGSTVVLEYDAATNSYFAIIATPDPNGTITNDDLNAIKANVKVDYPAVSSFIDLGSSVVSTFPSFDFPVYIYFTDAKFLQGITGLTVDGEDLEFITSNTLLGANFVRDLEGEPTVSATVYYGEKGFPFPLDVQQ